MLGAISSLRGSSSGYKIPNSLRFRASNSAYLTRTPSVAGSQTTWTWSGWIKTSNFSGVIFNGGTIVNGVSGNYTAITIGETIGVYHYNGTINNVYIATNAVYRDPSAWYHLVVTVNTTLATSTDRIKIYINGILQTATGTYPTLNFSTAVNSTLQHRIGSRVSDGFGGTNWLYFDGYLTEVNFIDGQALDVSSFGTINNTTGVWAPKAYTGTYGTNGFYLKFADASGATATTIGKDSSGNSNNWTPSGISVTAGATYDSMIDTPTPYADGTVYGRGNYATGNPLDAETIGTSYATWTQGNLQLSCPSGTVTNVYSRTSQFVSSGKWYVEVTCNLALAALPSSGVYAGSIGIAKQSGTGGILANAILWASNANTYRYGILIGSLSTATVAVGEVFGLALDLNAGTLVMYRNGVLAGTIDTGITGEWSFAGGGYGAHWLFNFGQRPFTYTPPTGFLALNTQNLPVPTIRNGALYTAATTYTGTGASRSISNTVNNKSFQPDLVWIKGRSGATDHALYDSVRGVQKDLVSNTNAAETTQATGLLSFDTAGATIGALAKLNTNAATYVAWQWKAGGTTASNTAGTITSQVNAGMDQGFSVVSYTGNGTAGATVGHGLGTTPSMIIARNRADTSDWSVYHQSLPESDTLFLNQTTISSTYLNRWAKSGFTSSVFKLGSNPSENNNGSVIAYCFAEVAGYSKFGSYTGNGSVDGPFVFCGFRPRWILIKTINTSADGAWCIYDSSRTGQNCDNAELGSHVNTAEADNNTIDILSNGFKLRTTYTSKNTSGSTYIFAAFAEVPSKYALAR